MILVPLSDHPYYLWQALVQMRALEGRAARWLVYCPTGSPSPLLAGIVRAGVADVTAWPDWPRDPPSWWGRLRRLLTRASLRLSQRVSRQ